MEPNKLHSLKHMVCGYSHCKHENKEVSKEDGIKVGNRYWHKDCYEESTTIREVIDIFKNKCNPQVVVPALRNVINNIVYKQGTDVKLLLFGIKYYVNHRIPLNYPGGLYYVLQNKDVQNEWKKVLSKQMKMEFHLDENMIKEEPINTNFKYKDTNKSKFSGILGKA